MAYLMAEKLSAMPMEMSIKVNLKNAKGTAEGFLGEPMEKREEA